MYFSSGDLVSTHSRLLQLLRGSVTDEFEHALYSYFGADSFHHLARVTAGLDSAVLGETEIQGQVKSSYQDAHTRMGLSKELHFVFQKSLKIGKQVRNRYLIEKGIPDLSGAIYKMGSMVLDKPEQRSILFVGASEINLKVLRYLKLRGIKDLTLCNRTMSKGQQIAREEGVHCMDWSQLPRWSQFDWIIVGTKSPEYLLHPSEVTKGMSKKLIIDLSLPRNVDPAVGRHPKVLLFNIDQINHAVDTAQAEVKELLRQADDQVGHQVHRELHIYQERQSCRLQLAQ